MSPVTVRDMTYSDAERLALAGTEAERTLQMDEEAFRAFYDRTARPLWAYLARTTGSPSVADDLLQDAYYRFIRSGARLEGEAHQRHYLFRIATNLVHDRYRRARPEEPYDEQTMADGGARGEPAESLERRHELRRGLARLKSRERQLLWLAYAEGSSHQEIAEMLGVKASGVRVLLFRARRKLADLLGGGGGGKGGSRGDR